MTLSGLLDRKVRGFRVLDVTALAVFLVLALTVYAFKSFAGDQRADIVDIENQIHDETRSVRLLRAKVAELENPVRLARLADHYGEKPITVRQEVTPEALPQVAIAKPVVVAPASNAVVSTDAATPPVAPAGPPAGAKKP